MSADTAVNSVGGARDEVAMQENVDPRWVQLEGSNVNDSRDARNEEIKCRQLEYHFADATADQQSSKEKANIGTIRRQDDAPKGPMVGYITPSSDQRGDVSKRLCEATSPATNFGSCDSLGVTRNETNTDSQPVALLPTSEPAQNESASARDDFDQQFDCATKALTDPGSRTCDEDAEVPSPTENTCARTYIAYDRSKRRCLEIKNAAVPLKNSDNGILTVNKRKKTIPQKAVYHLQSVHPTPDDKQECCWGENKNFNRSPTPIITCAQKINGAARPTAEARANGHALDTKGGKRCAETYLSPAHLWPSAQGTAQKSDTSQLESSWISAYYANLFFSSFPLMFQNHASMFPYPFLPSLNNPLNFLQQAPSFRSNVSTASSRKSSLNAQTSNAKSDISGNKMAEKNAGCESACKTSLAKSNTDTISSLKYPGGSAPSFWPQVENATQDLKRKHLSSDVADSKALDLSKASSNKKSRRSQSNSRSNYDILENDASISYPYHQSVFSEFLRSPFIPKLSSNLDSEIKDGGEYFKSFNGNESIKRSLYGNHSGLSNPNFSKCQGSYGKSRSTGLTGDMGWMANDLLLQPPLLPTLTFLKWSPEELSEYVGNIDGCSDTAKALRLHGISGSRLPMLTLDSMTQELGLSMSSAQSLMNIVRNLLSVTIPGEAL